MSEYIFKLPDLGEGTVESEIAEWMVKVGDTVREEDPICSMLTDKAAIELSSPVNGTVKSVAGEIGDVIAVGSPLIVF
ncbi:MAG TPA: biotin/lipoyl-containing protein [Xanthomonadales bacterium]|nr:biotin/lipoyl-containing protein [Xanthomonadales bacterium]